MAEVLKAALTHYWAFMGAHPYLGVILTLGAFGWLVSGLRALRGLPEERTAETPAEAAQELAASVIPSIPPIPAARPAEPLPSRYDRLIGKDSY